jgi:hypothetical protein
LLVTEALGAAVGSRPAFGSPEREAACRGTALLRHRHTAINSGRVTA